jgi:hypothetical protein
MLAEASGVDHPVVTLVAPPPLDVVLAPHRIGDAVGYRDGDRPIARVESGAPLVVDPLPWLDEDAVVAASAAMRRLVAPEHPFPTCFGCGHARPAGDGLELMAGEVPGTGLFAALWRHAVTEGDVPAWQVWAALDCPSGHACLPQISDDEAIVLGRFAVDIRQDVRSGADHEIVVRAYGREGRRIKSEAAVVDASGANLAVATSVWVTIPR